jgi:glutamate-ammonia-ligase adenylyltransferase
MSTAQAAGKDDAAIERGIDRALRASPFLARSLARLDGRPALLRITREPWTRERIDSAIGQASGSTALEAALREVRLGLQCGQLVREAAGLATLEETLAAMTALAEVAVERLVPACHAELAAERGGPVDETGAGQHLLVVAMGKAGSGELNVSSDLDLVFAYAGEGATGGPAGDGAGAIDNQEFFARLGRRVIAGLSQEGPQGFVFRVDMRLRPHGDSGPLVVSVAMLEEYLQREGREWERFAWAKARVLPVLARGASAGEREGFLAQCRALEQVVTPFVFRKYHDFGSVGALRDLHRRIGEARDRRAARGPLARAASSAGPGAAIDVKVGRGGIREVEFLVQSFSIMRGGREPELRERGVPAALQLLARRGLVGEDESRALEQAWRLLRRVEHALQWREDAQTHALEPGGPSCEAAAVLLGFAAADDLLAEVGRANETIARAFDALLAAPGACAAGPAQSGEDMPEPAELRQLGFGDPAACIGQLAALIDAPRWREASAGTRATVALLARRAVHDVAARATAPRPAGLASPDELLVRWIRFIESVGRRSTYLTLLAEWPRAQDQVLMVLDAGGWAAQYLHRHPVVLDEMLARADAGEGIDAQDFDERLRAFPGDVERQMNVLRDLHHGQLFRMLLADLRADLPLERLADRLSALADAAIEAALRGAWRALHEPGGGNAGAAGIAAAPPPAPPPLAVIAYGKLGGLELGYASDLDLIFVTGDDPGEAAITTRWVRQFITWITASTSSGTLFEIDLRLRPNGNAGLLVTPFSAFERYQRNDDGRGAWVWEHQALTRARFCGGDPVLGARVEALRREVLARPRDAAALAGEVLQMRARMLEGHPNRSGRFDLKHDRGGMVDVEFANQYLVLAHAHDHARLLGNPGNLALLRIAGEEGLLPADIAASAASAYRQYRETQHLLRRNGAERALVERESVATHVQAVKALWRAVFQTDQP